VGGLGQGKSTVLYAFDFVLFGDPLVRSYDYLLRENAEKGKVTAIFIQNGKKYKLQRALQRQKKGINQDIDQLKFYRDDKLIASNKNEAVAEEIKALTGLDKNIFREVVWVRQEHLKRLIDTTPRQRQKRIDQLFGLSDYESAWSTLQLFQRSYEGEKTALDRDIDVIRILKLESTYQKTVEENSVIIGQIKDTKLKLEDAKTRVNKAISHLESLEELRKITEGLQRKEIQIQTNISNLNSRIEDLVTQKQTNKSRLDDYKRLIEKMETQKNSHKNGLDSIGLSSDITLENLRKYLNAVEKQLRRMGGEKISIKTEMSTSKNKISSIISKNKCPRCLQKLSGEYKEILKENLQKEQTENKKRLKELETKNEKLKSQYDIVNSAFSNLRQLIPRIEDQKKQVREKLDSLTVFSDQLEEATIEKEKLQEQLFETQKEIIKFDVRELESAQNEKTDAVAAHIKVKYKLKSLMTKKSDLGLRLDGLKERLDNAQTKINRKEKIQKLLEIIDRIRAAYRSIQPKLRSEFITYLQMTVQQQLDNLTGDIGPTLNVKIDECYSPLVSSEVGYEREVTNLSGGERTLLAFAYRIGLGQLIMQSRMGHGLYMLLLDEPTESLGREDGSVDRLAEAVSRLKAIEQIIAVTHNESFARKAEHIIRIEKKLGASQVYIEK
jgi:exonuclease SbcC